MEHAALSNFSTNLQTVTASHPHACKQLHNITRLHNDCSAIPERTTAVLLSLQRDPRKDRCRLAFTQHDMYRTFTVAPQTGRSAALGLYKATSLVTVSHCSASRHVSTPAFRLSILHVYLRSCQPGYNHLSPATAHDTAANNPNFTRHHALLVPVERLHATSYFDLTNRHPKQLGHHALQGLPPPATWMYDPKVR
jgi:hypothetical protein